MAVYYRFFQPQARGAAFLLGHQSAMGSWPDVWQIGFAPLAGGEVWLGRRNAAMLCFRPAGGQHWPAGVGNPVPNRTLSRGETAKIPRTWRRSKSPRDTKLRRHVEEILLAGQPAAGRPKQPV